MRLALLATILLTLFAASTANAHPPYGLVADAHGNVYFSDLEAVWRLAPDGRLDLFRPPGEGFHVHELAPGPDGSIEGEVNHYDPATEAFSGGLWRRTPDGQEQWLVAPSPAPPRGLGTFSDARGNRYLSVWVSNEDRRTMLFRRSPDGRLDLLHGPSDAAARFRQALIGSVGGMAAVPGGAMVFADGRTLRRVEVSGAHDSHRGGQVPIRGHGDIEAGAQVEAKAEWRFAVETVQESAGGQHLEHADSGVKPG